MRGALRRPGRRTVLLLALIGAGLIAAPAIFSMFDRAPKGATMIDQFRPYMTAARLGGYQREIRQIDAGVREGTTRLSATLSPPSRGGRAAFDARFPEFAGFAREWGTIDADMSSLLSTIRGNLGNYQAVAALPRFTLFPWFFVIPGALIILALAVAMARGAWWGGVRWALGALGIGLVLAPVAFQMFDRAPKGGHMMDAFKPIETRHKVETIQGYFGSIAVGQGSVRLQLVPALRRTGLSAAQVAARFPAVTTLDRRWVPILNDFTPMIGTMSDNVDNYDAVAALPPFPLFPWFFVIPGVLVAGLALSPLARRGARAGAAGVSAPSLRRHRSVT